MSRSTKIKYRCSRCRTRNTFAKRLEEYVREKKCHSCGHTKFYWDKERNKRRHACNCGGCHYPHRPGSCVCEDHPEYSYGPPDSGYYDT